LTFHGLDWDDSYNSFVKLDYSKYRQGGANPDLELTPEQILLFHQLESSRNEYIAQSKHAQEENAKSLKVFGINLNEISSGFKLLYTVAFFAIFILGVLYLLKKVQPVKKEKKKKNK
jgi:hypothetical protein